jgi:hypothetical protein
VAAVVELGASEVRTATLEPLSKTMPVSL